MSGWAEIPEHCIRISGRAAVSVSHANRCSAAFNVLAFGFAVEIADLSAKTGANLDWMSALMSTVDEIKDDRARQDIQLELAAWDKSIADNLDRLKEDQTIKINAEINKEVNKQGNPALTTVGFEKSPQAIAQKVQVGRLPEQKIEHEAYVRGSFDVANSPIDKNIQKTLEQ